MFHTRYRLKQQSEIKNLFVAGDWVRDLDHGSDGLSQERALVSGYQAANLALQHFRSECKRTGQWCVMKFESDIVLINPDIFFFFIAGELATGLGDDVSILPVESDETHVSFGKNLYNNLRQGMTTRLWPLTLEFYKWYRDSQVDVQVMNKLGELFQLCHSNRVYIRLEMGSGL